MKYFAALISLFVMLVANPVSAATMGISSPASVQAGDIVTARVVVNSGGVAINNAEATLMFPSDVLNVVSISKSGSIFSLWVEEPAFSNAAGSITFNGGVPNPGFTGSAGTIISVTFQAKKAGTASLSLSGAAVRANDGLGTNVLQAVNGAQITVSAVATPVVQPSATTPTISSGEKALSLRSSTHPDQNGWYPKAVAHFEWTLPSGVTSVQTGVGANPSAAPQVTYAPPINVKDLDPLEDGVWYFKMRYKTAGEWSTVSTYRVNIDTSKPEISSHELSYDAGTGELLLRVAATDTGSGVGAYEVIIDSGKPIRISTDEQKAQPYRVQYDSPGKHHVTLNAIDRAGNSASVESSFLVPQSVGNESFVRVGPVSFTLKQAFMAMFILTLLSLVIAVASALRLYRYRRETNSPHSKVHKDIHRGFALYRQDLLKDIEMLEETHKERALTREEKKLYKRMLANLEDLEKYVDKEIDKLE